MSNSLPRRMRAIDPPAPGGPEVLQVRELPVPVPAAGEVLIRVHAAGVNRPDVLQRMGHYPVPPGAPTTLGLEAAGEIVALGGDCRDWQVGDRVTALVAGGAYADYLVAPAGQCLPVPASLGFAEAAVLPETWFTVWVNLVTLANARAGETILIHGGTSGIGTTAIDFARVRGLRSIVTCGTDAKCAAARELGADHAINYRTADFVAACAAITNGQGVGIVLDMVGGDYFGRNLACLAADGRHVSIAFQRGARVELPLAVLMRKRLRLMGSMLRSRSVAAKTALADALRREIWPLFADGTLRPHLHRSFPLAQAADAHRLMEAGGHIGKIALRLGDAD